MDSLVTFSHYANVAHFCSLLVALSNVDCDLFASIYIFYRLLMERYLNATPTLRGGLTVIRISIFGNYF